MDCLVLHRSDGCHIRGREWKISGYLAAESTLKRYQSDAPVPESAREKSGACIFRNLCPNMKHTDTWLDRGDRNLNDRAGTKNHRSLRDAQVAWLFCRHKI